MLTHTYQQPLEQFNPDLFSSVRRAINSLKEKQVVQRKLALEQLLKIITTEQLPGTMFEQIGHMCIKDVLKCFSDHSETCRELATTIVIEILPRSSRIASFLPYIMSILVDRTNCHDLQGISNLPEKMRPPPGQKPKVLLKVVEPCEQIRVLYCNLIKKIVALLEHEGDQIRKHLDDLINVMRALIMDPAPEVQRSACESLELTCKLYKDLLLHYTEIMGRAVLLPLISKKSKIRIAGLNTLNAILWCGLYKYNAFVFQNLIGFRDPNSVPIKDFYQPSHNINYLATFITDPSNKVRLEFMRSIKMWICDLNDKYDHHGKLVPYLLSGLFDVDQQVQETALEAIGEIGRQIEEEREKDFRENKQFAIDAKWTWDGKLVGLAVAAPLKARPSLGSRFFIRGHVRKFWSALYRQVRDIKIENRIRACNLAIYGAVYTQNYLTQYLDDMIPQLLTSIICHSKQQRECCQKIEQIFFYIGRFCQQPSYLHIMKSALQGKLVQNQQFIKASLLALTRIVEGSLQAVPPGEGLGHKKQQVIELLSMVGGSGAMEEIYSYNCKEVQGFVWGLLRGVKEKGRKEEIMEILEEHFVTVVKLWGVGYYEERYVGCAKLDGYQQDSNNNNKVTTTIGNYSHEQGSQNQQPISPLLSFFHLLSSLSTPEHFTTSLQQYLSQVYQTPPSLMDSDFKLVIVLCNYLIKSPTTQTNSLLFSLTKEIIGESLSYNRSVEILNFCMKFVCWLWGDKEEGEKNREKGKEEEEKVKGEEAERVTEQEAEGKVALVSLATTSTCPSQTSLYLQLAQILQRCMSNLNKFKPQKKLATYDQHLLNEQSQSQPKPSQQALSNIMAIPQATFLTLFKNACQALRMFYVHKTLLTNSTLGQILYEFVGLGQKVKRSEEGVLESVKTLWVVFEREQVDDNFPSKLLFKSATNQQTKVLPLIIDFLLQRIETLGQPQHKKVSMLFSTFNKLLKCIPIFQNAATPLPLVYPQYNTLFQTLIKYGIDEKDVELKQKFVDLLRSASKRMRPWFELEFKMAQESEKFIKAEFLKGVLNVA